MTSQGATIAVSDAKLVLDWCIGACQHDSKGGILLAITMTTTISGDPSFGKWMYDRLETTLGQHAMAPSAALKSQPDRIAIISLVAAQVGRSVGKY